MGWFDMIFRRRGKEVTQPAPVVQAQTRPPSAAREAAPRSSGSDGIGDDIARFADDLLAERTQPRARTDRMEERFIDVAAMRDALSELGQMLRKNGQTVDLAVYGGSCLMLASNFRQSSGDVDAVAFNEDWPLIESFAHVIADRRGWPKDWINNRVANFLGNKPLDKRHHVLEGSYPDTASPGLRVFVPTATYALAMKLRAMRIDLDNDKDLDDIVNLMVAADIQDREELVRIARTFYNEKDFGGKLYSALDDLWGEYLSAKERMTDDPPRYLV